MNARRRRTLSTVFTDPVTGTLEWAALEALLLTIRCELVEGRGSRVRFVKDGMVETFPTACLRKPASGCDMPPACR